MAGLRARTNICDLKIGEGERASPCLSEAAVDDAQMERVDSSPLSRRNIFEYFRRRTFFVDISGLVCVKK